MSRTLKCAACPASITLRPHQGARSGAVAKLMWHESPDGTWALCPTCMAESRRYEHKEPPAIPKSTGQEPPRLLQPERPRLGEALRVAERGYDTGGDGTDGGWEADPIRTPDEAWEALIARGIIPERWLQHPERRFVRTVLRCIECNRANRPLDRCWCPTAVFSWLPYPLSVEDCVAFASDPEGIETAEALSREIFRRLFPSYPRVDYIEWRMVSKNPWAQSVYWKAANTEEAVPPGWPSEALRPAVPLFKRRVPRRDAPPWWHWGESRMRAWRESLIEGPNPYEPLVALWATGYVLVGLHALGPVLGAPMLDGRP